MMMWRCGCEQEESWPDVLQSLVAKDAWFELFQALERALPAVSEPRLPPPSRLLLLQMTGDALWSPTGALLAAEEGAAEGAALREASEGVRKALQLACEQLLREHVSPGF